MSAWDETVAGFRRFVGGVSDALAPLLEAVGRYYAGLSATAATFRRLIPLGRDGWAISTYGMMIAPEAHAEAAELAASDRDGAADRLERLWSDPDTRRLLCSLVPYVYPAEQRAIALRRQELLERASARFEEELYEEAVLLVYSQLDGIFRDRAEAEGERAYSRLFSRRAVDGAEARQFEDLVADTRTMINTEDEFFLAVREGLSAEVNATTLDDDPSRHGVLHGRVLGYGTRRRAAQSFAFLAASLELLIASYDTIPMTEEEAQAPTESMTPGMTLILAAMAWSPVRSVYVSMPETGDGALVTVPQEAKPPGGRGSEPQVGSPNNGAPA